MRKVKCLTTEGLANAKARETTRGGYLYLHLEEIKQQIRELKYKQSPVRRVEIPKENGKMRKLGISKYNSYMVANTRRGYYWVASTIVLHITIFNKRLKQKELVFPL